MSLDTSTYPSTARLALLPGLTADAWRLAGQALLAKMIGELAYEEMLTPEPAGAPGETAAGTSKDTAAEYRLALPGGVVYAFRARRGSFGAWRIDPATLVRRCASTPDGTAAPADDPVRFVLDARAALGLDGVVVADLLRELIATQAADTRLRQEAPDAATLADLPYVELESHQTGHPCMFLNKGRLGFSASDVARYTPEARRPLRLWWLAAHRDLAGYQGVAGLPADRLLAEELDAGTRARFAAVLAERGVDPAGYMWFPVHPFHLDEAVLPLFAPYLADGRLVPLGEAPDRYRPLQSVRTLANVDAPGKRDVKLPLLIRNTLVWRGLSTEPTVAAPDVTAWLRGIRDRDPFLRDEARIVLLGEVASVAVRHPAYEEVADAPYRYHELLGAVWREPVQAHLEPGERARTMAALLWVDPHGRALVEELVARSGLDARAWLRRFFRALLPGLLHYLYRYGVAFCPHGENTVVIYDERDVPVRIAVKDFAEDVNLVPQPLPEYADLPPRADAVLLRWPPADLCHSIQSAIFAGHFRFFTDVVERHLGVPEGEFWAMVRAEVLAYQERFPELAERFAMFDLLAPTFGRVCLNREQLLGGGFHDRADRDESFDVMHGVVPNPLHR
ncbi:IucA/IucC family protein [Carbonactinospora thermoautotrophica]|uniref:IucA/IucC family protein n=1 Tax=Carbonactinospora thermoautotrophica TaxID=1469144 RepID=UPI00226E03A7|nr:IucA/IucC family siderophore biosynthesis protein [Carbonactinospora thermoautotrophica]